MILDTTFIIDFLRGNETAVEIMQGLESAGEPIATTCISVFEVTQGIREIKEEKKAEEFFSSIHAIPLVKRSAFTAGRVRRKLVSQGITIDPEDAMIAGIAMARHETIVTRNVKHFSSVSGLKVKSY